MGVIMRHAVFPSASDTGPPHNDAMRTSPPTVTSFKKPRSTRNSSGFPSVVATLTPAYVCLNRFLVNKSVASDP